MVFSSGTLQPKVLAPELSGCHYEGQQQSHQDTATPQNGGGCMGGSCSIAVTLIAGTNNFSVSSAVGIVATVVHGWV